MQRSDERKARDSFRTPAIRFGQGDYVENYEAERRLGPIWLVCVAGLAMCGIAAWMIS